MTESEQPACLLGLCLPSIPCKEQSRDRSSLPGASPGQWSQDVDCREDVNEDSTRMSGTTARPGLCFLHLNSLARLAGDSSVSGVFSVLHLVSVCMAPLREKEKHSTKVCPRLATRPYYGGFVIFSYLEPSLRSFFEVHYSLHLSSPFCFASPIASFFSPSRPLRIFCTRTNRVKLGLPMLIKSFVFVPFLLCCSHLLL